MLRLAETEGLSWNIDETKPAAKHFAAPENRRSPIDPFAIAAIRLLIVTGARLREILYARWEHVDFNRKLLFVSRSAVPVPSAACEKRLAGPVRLELNRM